MGLPPQMSFKSPEFQQTIKHRLEISTVKVSLVPIFEELYTATKIPLMFSFSGNSAASAPISTFMCLSVIYIVPGSVYIFPPAE
jgi:hypothetical protein